VVTPPVVPADPAVVAVVPPDREDLLILVDLVRVPGHRDRAATVRDPRAVRVAVVVVREDLVKDQEDPAAVVDVPPDRAALAVVAAVVVVRGRGRAKDLVRLATDPVDPDAGTMDPAVRPRRAAVWATVPDRGVALTGVSRAARGKDRPPRPAQDRAAASRVAVVRNCQRLVLEARQTISVDPAVVPHQDGNAMPSGTSSTSVSLRKAWMILDPAVIRRHPAAGVDRDSVAIRPAGAEVAQQ